MPEPTDREHDKHRTEGSGSSAQRANSKSQLEAAIAALKALAEIIHHAGEVPSGELYARLMGKVSLEDYTRLIETLKRTGLVTETPGHLLRWNGPTADTEGHA